MSALNKRWAKIFFGVLIGIAAATGFVSAIHSPILESQRKLLEVALVVALFAASPFHSALRRFAKEFAKNVYRGDLALLEETSKEPGPSGTTVGGTVSVGDDTVNVALTLTPTSGPAKGQTAPLTKELLVDGLFESRAKASRELFEFIEIWYNRLRRHSSLGYRSPMQYETEILKVS